MKKIHSADEIPIIEDGYSFKYVMGTGVVAPGEPITAAGMKSPTATELAAAGPKGPQALKSEDKGGYAVDMFTDGTYGYTMPDGTSKNGYKSKGSAAKAGKKLAAKAQGGAQAELLEKQARELQGKLQLAYADAVDGMASRIEASLKEFAAEDAKWAADVAAGKKDAKAYKAWRKDQALHNDRLNALKKALAQDLTAADKTAMAYVNQVPAGVYAEGMNFATYEVEHGAKANTSFTLYDKDTVMELVANEPGLLPQAAFDKAKDSAWNSRHVTSAVTQAVLQGQTAPQLAASIAGIAAMDQRAAMKAARTAMTSAHSLGKLKGYERAAGMGIDVGKQWLAALDSRTRGSHRHLDGETAKLDAEFSNGLKYPGDPDGPGSEVYNCRCTLVPVIGDVRYDGVERADKLGDMTYGQWRNEHEAEKAGTHEFSENIKWVQGNADLETTGDPGDMSWVNEAARRKWGQDAEKVRTYRDFESYLGNRGIELDTTSEALKTEFHDRDMPKAVKKQVDQIMAALDNYDEIGGVRGMKKLHLYDDSGNAAGQAAYYYRVIGEAPFDNEGEIYFENDDLRMYRVMHEFALAYADGIKPEGYDAVTWSAKLNSEAKLGEPQGAYSGAASGVVEAERFADAIAKAFTTNDPGDKAMLQAFLKRVAEIIGEMT